MMEQATEVNAEGLSLCRVCGEMSRIIEGKCSKCEASPCLVCGKMLELRKNSEGFYYKCDCGYFEKK